MRRPTPWNLAQRGVDEFDFFMAGEAEVDEPFPVNRLGHFLQDGNSPGVVLNQVVIGREDAGDFALGLWGRDSCADGINVISDSVKVGASQN